MPRPKMKHKPYSCELCGRPMPPYGGRGRPPDRHPGCQELFRRVLAPLSETLRRATLDAEARGEDPCGPAKKLRSLVMAEVAAVTNTRGLCYASPEDARARRAQGKLF